MREQDACVLRFPQSSGSFRRAGLAPALQLGVAICSGSWRHSLRFSHNVPVAQFEKRIPRVGRGQGFLRESPARNSSNRLPRSEQARTGDMVFLLIQAQEFDSLFLTLCGATLHNLRPGELGLLGCLGKLRYRRARLVRQQVDVGLFVHGLEPIHRIEY